MSVFGRMLNGSVAGLSVSVSLSLTAGFELGFLDSGPSYSSALDHLVRTFARSFYDTFGRVLTVVFYGHAYLTLGFPKIFSSRDASCTDFPQQVGVRLVHGSVFFSFLAMSLSTGTSEAGLGLNNRSKIFLFELVLGPGGYALLVIVFPLGEKDVSGLTREQIAFGVSFPS